MAENDSGATSPTRTKTTYTFKEAQEYEKQRISKPTGESVVWRDIHTGTVVNFNY